MTDLDERRDVPMCTTWADWEAALELETRDLRPGDVILAHPEAGPFGPWEVRELRPSYRSLTRYDVVTDCDTWFGRESGWIYRVRRTCGRPIAALANDGTRDVRRCAMLASHGGVCRYEFPCDLPADKRDPGQ